jgi:AcrR family transcriptional regulator
MLGSKSAEKSVTEVRLVEAAAQLFARHGFKATTTREIASFADLNEATLFRYFPRKSDLFWAAVESHVARVRMSRDLQTSLVAEQPPRDVVPKIVRFLLDTLRLQPELERLLHVAAFELPEANTVMREYLGPTYDMICDYFRRCGERGAIRDVDPALVTLGLLGAVSTHQALYRLFSRETVQPLDPELAIAAYSRFVLDAIQAVPVAQTDLPAQEN